MDKRTSVTPPHAEFFPPPASSVAPSRWLGAVSEDIRLLVQFRAVIQNMVMQELRVRYHRSVLGFLWTLLNPILMMTTLTVVFSQVLMRGSGDPYKYAIHLFAGMLPWTMFQVAVTESAFCIIQNENLIRKIYLPKMIFPLNRLLIAFVTLSLSMAAMFILLVPLGAKFSWAMLMLPLAMVLLATFTLGLGLIVATANTFYRDCSHLVAVFLQAWYFATPIIYWIDMVPAEGQWRFWLNPAYPFIRIFQVIIEQHEWPDLGTIVLAVGIGTTTLVVGYTVFKCHEAKLIFRL